MGFFALAFGANSNAKITFAMISHIQYKFTLQWFALAFRKCENGPYWSPFDFILVLLTHIFVCSPMDLHVIVHASPFGNKIVQ